MGNLCTSAPARSSTHKYSVVPSHTKQQTQIYDKNVNDTLFGFHRKLRGIKQLFSATKYERMSDDDMDEHKSQLDELKKSIGKSHCDNNKELQPENGTPDICGISYMFSDKELSDSQKIIVMCLQMMKSDNYSDIEKLKDVSKEELKKNQEIITRNTIYNMVGDGQIYHEQEDREHILEYDIEDVEDMKIPPTVINTNEFMNILKTGANILIDKLSSSNKEKLKQSTVNCIQQCLSTISHYRLNRELTFNSIKNKILNMILHDYFKPITKTIHMVKKPEGFWDLEQFDTVFSESYDDDFGIESKSKHTFVTHFH